MISQYQKDFIRFLLESQVLQFGSFRTKSGRDTPYFINTGKLNTGESIGRLGSFYASHVRANISHTPNIIFGPAYKGIPLAVATSEALFRDFQLTTHYAFDRKEVKDYGDKGNFVGKSPVDGDRIVIVEDVVTAGTTLQSVVPMLRAVAKLEVVGVIISVDRCEVGTGSSSAVMELETSLGIRIFPVVTIHQVVSFLSSDEAGKNKLSSGVIDSISKYLETYGAKVK